MMQLSFGTVRLKCRSLVLGDNISLRNVLDDREIGKYFQIGSTLEDASKYINDLNAYDALSVGIFHRSTCQLIGCISGYKYSGCELLVEFFIAENFRNQHLMFEALEKYFTMCEQKGFCCFRFDIEPNNSASISLVSKFGAMHFSGEDFEDGGRQFSVYRI